MRALLITLVVALGIIVLTMVVVGNKFAPIANLVLLITILIARPYVAKKPN